MDQEGTIIGSEFKRFSVRANLDAQLKKWWKIGLSVAYSSTDENMKLADSDEGACSPRKCPTRCFPLKSR